VANVLMIGKYIEHTSQALICELENQKEGEYSHNRTAMQDVKQVETQAHTRKDDQESLAKLFGKLQSTVDFFGQRKEF